MLGRTVSHYRILERLGGGGMGVLYKAEDTRLGRFVARKFLPETLAKDHLTLTGGRMAAKSSSRARGVKLIRPSAFLISATTRFPRCPDPKGSSRPVGHRTDATFPPSL